MVAAHGGDAVGSRFGAGDAAVPVVQRQRVTFHLQSRALLGFSASVLSVDMPWVHRCDTSRTIDTAISVGFITQTGFADASRRVITPNTCRREAPLPTLP